MEKLLPFKIMLRFLPALIIALTISIGSISLSRLSAQTSNADTERKTIRNIEIYGLNVIDRNLVLSTIETAPGSVLSPVKIANDIKELYKLNFFEDIQVYVNEQNDSKVELVFEFEEKPQILEISFEGNYEYDDGDLIKEIKTYKFNLPSENTIRSDMKKILDKYRQNGFYDAEVSYELLPLKDGNLKLVYYINEEGLSYLTEVNVTGPEFFYPLDIVRRMKSSVIDATGLSASGGLFLEEILNLDLYNIAELYKTNGFIKVEIDKPKVVLIKNLQYSVFKIDLNIKENDQYFLGKVDIKSNDEFELITPKEELIELLGLEEGEVFNPSRISNSRIRLDYHYQSLGYASNSVVYRSKINDETKTVDIEFLITRGEIYYINRINYVGNLDTRDYVLRREMTIFDNEIYNGSKLEESKRNLIRLGFFAQNAGVTPVRKSRDDRYELDYNFIVQEAQTGSLNGSLSYSDQGGAILGINVSKGNFLGRGTKVSGKFDYNDSGRKTLSFTVDERKIFDSEFNSSSSLTYDDNPRDRYNTTTVSLSQAIYQGIWRDWSVVYRYSIQQVDYTQISDDYINEFEEGTTSLRSSFRTGLVYNSVNNPRFPTAGSEYAIYLEPVGGAILGGTEEYLRSDMNFKTFYSLDDDGDFVVSFNSETTALAQTNDEKLIPTTRRLTIGGVTTVRGFGSGDIEGPSGPVEWGPDFSLSTLEDSSNDIDGDYDYFYNHRYGNISQFFNLELLFPLETTGSNIRGVLFVDAGNVWAEPRMYGITGAKNELTLRSSYGAGIRFLTPLGVLRFEYGTKIDKKENESPGEFHFFISQTF